MNLDGVIINIRCKEFEMDEEIPEKYTCDGQNINPSFEIHDIPEHTKSFALIVDDPDAPEGTFTHWVVWNIAPTETIDEDSVPGKQGKNDFNKKSYSGPCPSSGEHRYFFKLYALDDMLALPDDVPRETVIAHIQDHIIESCNTMGRYRKRT